MKLDDIVEMGYTKTTERYADYEIWAKNNSRVLFSPSNGRVVVEYNVNSQNGKEFHDLYVTEQNN
jgi:hypothetical protein